jgi:hypothetical protein
MLEKRQDEISTQTEKMNKRQLNLKKIKITITQPTIFTTEKIANSHSYSGHQYTQN